MSIRVLELAGSAREMGRAHGEALREEIHELAEIRLDLVADKATHLNEEKLLELAELHRAPIEAFDADAAEELQGIAEGAEIDWRRLLVLNAYTDFRDAAQRWERDEGCTIIYGGGPKPLVAQTWDMHSTAEPYVLALHVRPNGGPASTLFTVAGCVGMAGVNEHGLSCTINNLRPDDGRVGVSWPSLVRRVLLEKTAEAGVALFDGEPAGSGHHYLVADSTGRAASIETTGAHTSTRWLDAAPFVHTNHYLDAALVAHQTELGASTTFERYGYAEARLKDGALTQDALQRVLGDHEGYPRSICSHLAEAEPDMSKTCGALVCDLETATMYATRGCAHEAEFTEIRLRA